MSTEDYVAELDRIKNTINTVIVATQTEFQEDLQVDYDVVGAIVYGSFARGKVHDQSDTDLILLATEELHDLLSNFSFRLEQAGIGRGGIIG